MKQTIEAKERDLGRVFNDDYLFDIPQYQRPYSWTEEQVSELLSDLIWAMGSGDDISETSPYFLGSIVLIRKPPNANAEVVDGQQRLTTLTMLFCVLGGTN